jgi:hypothetical protein
MPLQIVQHRVNTIEQLNATPKQYGVELDIRDKYDELIIEHDAFNKGTNWDNYINAYEHSLLIANVKTEGIEQQITTDLATRNIENYFLLDVSLPFMVKLSKQGFTKMAVRFSEYEPIELAMQFAGKVEWLWVDCFTYLPLNNTNYEQLKKYFKICIVSPELQQQSLETITIFKEQLNGLAIDAVCTKRPDLWL